MILSEAFECNHAGDIIYRDQCMYFPLESITFQATDLLQSVMLAQRTPGSSPALVTQRKLEQLYKKHALAQNAFAAFWGVDPRNEDLGSNVVWRWNDLVITAALIGVAASQVSGSYGKLDSLFEQLKQSRSIWKRNWKFYSFKFGEFVGHVVFMLLRQACSVDIDALRRTHALETVLKDPAVKEAEESAKRDADAVACAAAEEAAFVCEAQRMLPIEEECPDDPDALTPADLAAIAQFEADHDLKCHEKLPVTLTIGDDDSVVEYEKDAAGTKVVWTEERKGAGAGGW